MTSIADSSLHADAEADETTFNGTVSDFSSQSSRQASPQLSQPAPMKVLTRPVSSGQHPAAGFSFTKAKPIQQFDFRRPKQLQSPPLPDTAQTVQNAINLTDHRVPSPKHVLKDPLPVPFPNIVPARSRAYGHSTPNTAKDVSRPNASLSDAPLNEVPMPADDVLTDSVLNGTKPLLTAPVFSHSPSEMIGTVDKQPVHMQHRSNKKSKDFLTSVAGTPKITKSRWRKPKTGPTTKGPNRKDTYTDVDLLNLLMYRRRQGQQELDNFRATQSGMEAEMLKLRDMTNDLSGQLQEAIHRTTQKSAELSKVKSSMPIWESKIKRLSDYVKGLTNDHKRLREDADDMNKQYQHVFVAKKQLQNTLDDARKSFEQERIRFQQLDDDARHKVETLTQTIQHQSTQLQTDEDLLMVERERSDRLEEQIVRVTTSHGQLSEILTGHRDSIACKIDELLHQARSIVPPNGPPESNSHNSIKPMLEQCFGILQELHKTTHVKPEDLQRLNNNMDTFAEGIARSVETCEESSISIEAGQRQLALAVQDQLHALSDNLSSEHALSEQISDLREVRATVRERLYATETSLADARNEVIALQFKDQEKSRRIVTLETIATRAQTQPTETPQTLLRIQELDSRNRNLESENVTLRKEAADISSQLQQISTDAGEATERWAAIQEQLEAANRKTMELQEEKSISERQAVIEQEQLRKEVSTTVKKQFEYLENEHMETIKQARSEKSSAEERLKNVTKQLSALKVENQKTGQEVGSLKEALNKKEAAVGSLKEALNKKEAAVGSVKALELHIKEMGVRMHHKDNEYSNLQGMLNSANDRMKVKESEIMALQASQATRASSSRAGEHRSSIRGAQSTQKGQPLHRDPPHVSINQNPSMPTVDPMSSKHFTNRPAVVEDSQPTDKPVFVSLDDLMLEDPFAGYAREGSQTIGGEDIAHLFPSTPGAGSRVKEHDYSQNSTYHATVVSETQRRQHPSFRAATPHTGTHATNKSHSQSQMRTHSKSAQSSAMPKPLAVTSPTNLTSRHHNTNTPSSQREASITRESTLPQGSVKDPRQGKRNTVTAGFNDTKSHARPSKVQKSNELKHPKNLGPIIEDSQSPLLNGRSRKMSRRTSTAPKEDKYTRRFAQG